MNIGNMKAGKNLVLMKMYDILNVSNSELIDESGIKDIEIISYGRKDAGSPPIIVGPPSLKDSAEFISNHMTSTRDKTNYIIRATFEDAVVSGFGNLITRNNILIYDSCWEAIQNRSEKRCVHPPSPSGKGFKRAPPFCGSRAAPSPCLALAP